MLSSATETRGWFVITAQLAHLTGAERKAKRREVTGEGPLGHCGEASLRRNTRQLRYFSDGGQGSVWEDKGQCAGRAEQLGKGPEVVSSHTPYTPAPTPTETQLRPSLSQHKPFQQLQTILGL